METFGQALRRWREIAGLSQPELARRVPVSQATVSRWESGKQSVDSATAGQLDDILGANGELVALRQSASPANILNADDHDRITRIAEKPRTIDRRGLDSLAVVLAEYRRMEDTLGVGAVFDPTRAHLRLLRRVVLDARDSLRPAIVDLAAQWAQFAGWLHAATGHHDAANALFSRTLEWAMESENATLQANALTFKGNLAREAGHAGSLVGLSQAAQRRGDVYVGQLAFAAVQEARGHAMSGDVAACEKKMNDATALAERIPEEAENAPPWNYDTLGLITLERGMVYLDAKRYRAATEVLPAGLETLPEDQQSAEWTGDYRRALAAAQAEL